MIIYQRPLVIQGLNACMPEASPSALWASGRADRSAKDTAQSHLQLFPRPRRSPLQGYPALPVHRRSSESASAEFSGHSGPVPYCQYPSYQVRFLRFPP